jgi:hypothetical protein
MKKGIQKTILFYGIGLGLTGLTYLVFGPGYGHGPGFYIIVPFLTLLIGLFWTGSTLLNYYTKNKTSERRGFIYSQMAVFTLSILTIVYVRSQTQYPEPDSTNEQKLTTTQKNGTITVKYDDTVIYYKVGDSVYFDKRDSLFEAWK